MRVPTIECLVKWIKHAWDSISPDTIWKSFKKTGIYSALDVSDEDDMFGAAPEDEKDLKHLTKMM